MPAGVGVMLVVLGGAAGWEKCRKGCNLLLGGISTYAKVQVNEFFELGVGDEDLRFATFPTFSVLNCSFPTFKPVRC